MTEEITVVVTPQPTEITVVISDVGLVGPPGADGTGGGGGGAAVTLDADGTLIVDGLTVELATDAQVAAAVAAEALVRSAADTALVAADAALTASLAGKADLVSGTVPDSQIHSSIARDTEVTAAVAAEAAARATAISTAVNNLVNGAPGLLDTLGEIATQLAADESGAAALAATVAGKQPLDADLTTIAAVDSTTAGVLVTDGSGWLRKTYAQLKTALVLVKADVGLGSVDNTADSAKPVSTAQQAALDGKLTIASNLSDLANAGTARTNLGLGNVATRAVGTTAGTAAAGDDSRFTDARTPTAHAASHASGGSDAVTLAQSQVTNLSSDLALKAPLASPALTGTPTAPTAAAGTSTTQVATTAFTTAAVAALVNSAPGILDTLGEIATALQADESTAAALATTVAGKVPASLVDAKGDLLVATADNTVARQPVGSNGRALRANSALTNGVEWQDDPYPNVNDHQFLAQTLDPRYLSTNTVTVAVTGRSLLTRIRVGPACTITNVSFGVRTAGATFVNSNAIGLYDASGTLLTQTADLATVVNSTGFKTVAFAAPQSAAAGAVFYLDFLNSSTTLVALLGMTMDGTASIGANLGAAGSRVAYTDSTTRTALPASYTYSSATASGTIPWYGLS